MDSNSIGPSVDDAGLLRLSLWTPETSRRCVPDGKCLAFFLLRLRSRRSRSGCWHWQRASRIQDKRFADEERREQTDLPHLLPRACWPESPPSPAEDPPCASSSKTDAPPTPHRQQRRGASSAQ